MSTTKISFRDTQYYPIVFMLVITVIFVGILATFYRSTEKGVETYKQQTYQKLILSLFADTLASVTGLAPQTFTQQDLLKTNYETYVKELKLTKSGNGIINDTYFAIIVPNKGTLGYCFDLKGSGLWGTMKGLLALTPDFKTIINFAIYDQMETPGLGARVEETWFKAQFTGKAFISAQQSAVYTLIPEDGTPTGYEIRQVTGATITSASVLKILSNTAEKLEELSLNPSSELK
jgi:Na+-transporting NADH:ubiquinone oxidoreductase subunit C